MVKSLVTPHPVYPFDMVVTYDGDTQSIHYVTDPEGLPVELCQRASQAIQDAIKHAFCKA